MNTVETPAQKSARRAAAREAAEEKLQQRLVAEKLSPGQLKGKEWKGLWQEGWGAKASNQHTVKNGIYESLGSGVETLLQHYPELNVFLGFCMWRKLLFLYWELNKKNSRFAPPLDKDGAKASLALELELRRDPFLKRTIGTHDWTNEPLGTHPYCIGLSGSLRAFSTGLLATPGTGQERNYHQLVSTFILGLLRTDQVDLLAVLVERLRLDLSAECELHTPPIFFSRVNLLSLRILSYTTTIMPCGSLLHIAASLCPGLSVIRWLLGDNRWDCNTEWRGMGTPLNVAAGSNNEGTVALLIESKARVDAQDPDGKTALHSAASCGSASCATVLLKNGAEVDALDKDGYTPLHYAAGVLAVELARVLLGAGADPDGKAHNGLTPADILRQMINLRKVHTDRRDEILKALARPYGILRGHHNNNNKPKTKPQAKPQPKKTKRNRDVDPDAEANDGVDNADEVLAMVQEDQEGELDDEEVGDDAPYSNAGSGEDEEEYSDEDGEDDNNSDGEDDNNSDEDDEKGHKRQLEEHSK